MSCSVDMKGIACFAKDVTASWLIWVLVGDECSGSGLMMGVLPHYSGKSLGLQAVASREGKSDSVWHYLFSLTSYLHVQ